MNEKELLENEIKTLLRLDELAAEMSKPKINIDREQFEDLLRLQCTKEDVAGFFHCSHDTVERFCKRTYKKTFSEVAEDYKSVGRVSIRRGQFAAAEKGNVPMLIHLGKQYLGQTDKVETSVTGDMNVKHGMITKTIHYDPQTGNPIEENITGDNADVSAYLRDHRNYNGEEIAVYVPDDGRETARTEIKHTPAVDSIF